LEALCRTGSATTYAKHKCLHPPRTKNKNKPSNPTRSPTPPTQSQEKTQESHGERAGDEPVSKSEQKHNEKTARQPKPKPDSATAAQVKDPKTTASQRETIQAASANEQDRPTGVSVSGVAPQAGYRGPAEQ